MSIVAILLQAVYFKFIDAATQPDTSDPKNGRDRGTPNKPGFQVRQQTRDVASLLVHGVDKGHYYLFLEDDMQLCPQMFTVFQYLLGMCGWCK